jgi:hypothetical protein
MPLFVQSLPAPDVVQWRVPLCEGAAVRGLSISQSNDVIVVAPKTPLEIAQDRVYR